MGKAVAKFFGFKAPKIKSRRPKKFGGGFSGQKLSDIVGSVDPMNGVTHERHEKQLSSTPTRKVVFGQTAMPIDVVYFETYNNQKQYDEILVHAGHEIEGFTGTFWYEGVELSFDGSGNETGNFGTKLNWKNKTVGVTGTTLACGAGTIWTSTSSLTGCAYSSIRWTFDKDLTPDGISTEYMVEGKGALVYDPRLDSTRGGAGSHRADDQSTWQYNDGADDIGRNPALQILWWLLGWKEAAVSGEITCGRGVDPDDIDMASFITAANDYDTLGWFSDCVLDLGDSDARNLSILKMGCGAVLTDAGGLYSIHAPVDDTATVAVAFDEDDVAGGSISWTPKQKMQSQFNSVSGTFIDPSVQYRQRAYPRTTNGTYETNDGFKKPLTQSYISIQDSDQAQELNLIKLNQTRYQGILKMAVKQKGLIAKHYDVVTVTNSLYGFTNKKFRVMKQGITTDGYVELELQETDASIYTAGTSTTLPAAGTGTTFDPQQTYAVTGLGGAVLTETGSTGTISDGLTISWTDPGSNVVGWTEVRYKISTDSVWTYAPAIAYPAISTKVVPLESGTQYDIQARHFSTLGVQGAWSSTVNQTTGQNRDVAPNATNTSGANLINDPYFNRSDTIVDFWTSNNETYCLINTSAGVNSSNALTMTNGHGSNLTAEHPRSIHGRPKGSVGDRFRVYLTLKVSTGITGFTGSNWRIEAREFDKDGAGLSTWSDFLTAGEIITQTNYAENTFITAEGTVTLEHANVEQWTLYIVMATGVTGTVTVDNINVIPLLDVIDNEQQEHKDILNMPPGASGLFFDPTFDFQRSLGDTQDYWRFSETTTIETRAAANASLPDNGYNSCAVFDLSSAFLALHHPESRYLSVRPGDVIYINAIFAHDGNLTGGANDDLRIHIYERDGEIGSSSSVSNTIAVSLDPADYTADTWYDLEEIRYVVPAGIHVLDIRMTVSSLSTSAGEWYCCYFNAFPASVGADNTGSWVGDSGQIIPNWDMAIPDDVSKPAGWLGIQGIGSTGGRSHLTQEFTSSDVPYARIDSASDPTVAYGHPAIPINDQMTYELQVRHRSSATTANSFLIIANEASGPLNQGYTHVGVNAESSDSNKVQERDTYSYIQNTTTMPSTSWAVDTYTYTPTSGTEFATIGFYNWGSHTGTYDIDSVQIRPIISKISPTTFIAGNLSVQFTITSGGSIVMSSAGHIRGGQTAYDTGSGYWLGYDGAYKFSIGDGADNWLRWTGTALEASGNIYARAMTNDEVVADQWNIATTAEVSGGIGSGYLTAREIGVTRYGACRVVVQVKNGYAGAFTSNPGVRIAQNGVVVSGGSAINIAGDTSYTEYTFNLTGVEGDTPLQVQISGGVAGGSDRVTFLRETDLYMDFAMTEMIRDLI